MSLWWEEAVGVVAMEDDDEETGDWEVDVAGTEGDSRRGIAESTIAGD